MAQLKLTLSSEDKDAWMDFCKKKGLSSAAMIRKLIKESTGGVVGGSAERLEDVKNKRVSVRLSDKDFSNLTKRAKLEGFPSRPSWLKALIYASLDKEVVVSDKEILILDKSIRELMAIGRNLNQIARVLNIDFRNQHELTKELIEELIGKIDLHTDKVAELIQRSISRYEDELTE